MGVIAGILSVLLKIVLFLAEAFLLLLVLILVVPFKYSFSAVLKEKTIMMIKARWTIISVEMSLEDWAPSMKFAVAGRTFRSGRVERKSREKPEKKRRKRRGGNRKPGMDFFRQAFSFIMEVLSVLKPKEVSACGYFGFDDPADTAALASVLMLLRGCMQGGNIAVDPVFDSEVRDLEILVSGSIMLLPLVFITIKYLIKKEVRRVVFQKRTYAEAQNI